VPVLVLRESTERPEAIEAGSARLVGTLADRIEAAAAELLEDPAAREKMAQVRNPFGDGRASERILSVIRSELVQGGR
jgi:UDP-N-acetylglucosamine 2-epimerase (non-hydrolysing)